MEKPQITISEKLFKRLSIQHAILAGLLMAFISFVWDIYRDCYKDDLTLCAINSALIKSIVMGGIFFAVFSNNKHWRKQMIEGDKVEITKFQKICSIISRICGLLVLLGVILYYNHWRFAYIVMWFGGLSCFIIIVITLIFKRKNK